MDKIKYFGKVDEGKLKIYHAGRFVEDLKVFDGKQVEITVTRKVKSRSSRQLKYHWGVLIPCVREGLREMGNHWTIEKTHDFLKTNFLFDEIVNEATGEIYREPLSLKENGGVTTTRYMEFKMDVQQWADEFLGIYVPDPNEQLEIDVDNNVNENK